MRRINTFIRKIRKAGLDALLCKFPITVVCSGQNGAKWCTEHKTNFGLIATALKRRVPKLAIP